MAETLSPQQARARFRAVARGRYVDHGLGLEEAKARLAASDPGLDIAPLLGALEHKDRHRALAALIPWLWSSEGRRFLEPMFQRALLLAFRGIGVAQGLVRHGLAARSPSTKQKAGRRPG